MSKPMADLKIKLKSLFAVLVHFYKSTEILLLISVIPQSEILPLKSQAYI